MNKLRLIKKNLTIISNDKNESRHIGISLRNLGHNIYHYDDNIKFLNSNSIENIDLILVDLDNSNLNYKEFYNELIDLGYNRKIKIIAMSYNQKFESLVIYKGYNDFILKPLNIDGISARIQKIFHTEIENKKIDKIQLGNLFLDYEKWLCTWHGNRIELTKKEYLVLQSLVKRPGVVFERNQILDICYDENVNVDDRSVDSMIKRIRRKFEKVHPSKDKFSFIRTMYGTGYCWDQKQLYQS